MKTDEVWKIIEDYPNYMVSSHGRVMNYKRDRVLKDNIFSSGYKYVHLYRNGVSSNKLIHRLVALAFISNPENKPEVNHIDEVKANNSLSNLEWNTPQENTEHSKAKYYKLNSPEGEDVEIFNMAKFCRDNNLDKSALCKVVNNKSSNHKGWTKA